MKMNFLKIMVVFVAISFMSSCTHRLVGVWNVSRFETKTPNQAASSLQNIGYIEFKKKGEGEKQLEYLVLGTTQQDFSPFTWSWVDNKYVTITSEESHFSKTWIIIKNKKKHQIWESTDGGDTIISIELNR